MALRRVSATRTIPASAPVTFDVLADARQHSLIDGSGSLRQVRRAPERLFLGARFSMSMRIGAPYVTNNVVVEFEENKTIAWHHFARLVWRYDLEEVPGATRVTESFSYDNPVGRLVQAMGIPEKNRQAMGATLERLERLVTSSP